MRVISKRTWVFGLLTLLFVGLIVYCEWRIGCGPSWLPKVHAQEMSPEVGFAPDPCRIWRELPLLDKIAALGTFVFAVAFIFSLMIDIGNWFKRKRASRNI